MTFWDENVGLATCRNGWYATLAHVACLFMIPETFPDLSKLIVLTALTNL